jgi:hypothetical protein
MNRDATYEMLLHHSAPFECIPVLHSWNDLPSKFAVPPERDGRHRLFQTVERPRISPFAAA